MSNPNAPLNLEWYEPRFTPLYREPVNQTVLSLTPVMSPMVPIDRALEVGLTGEEGVVGRIVTGTRIEDLPSCLMIDILSRVPIETLVISRFVCKGWFLLLSDPEFVRLLSARSPTRLLSRRSDLKRYLKCYKSVGEMVGKDFETDSKVMIPYLTCANSCLGLLCLRKWDSDDEIYVCNPILREYITIPIVNRESFVRVKFILGFSSRGNQFKVLQINSVQRIPDDAYNAEIYTIGGGTRRWKSIGIAPPCTLDFPPDKSVDIFLNGSVHWTDNQTQQIVYFDFESEQFGSFPPPPAWSSFKVRLRVSVVDGCLCISALGYDCYHDEWSPAVMEKWVMKEYGVVESWTEIFSTDNNHGLTLSGLTLSDQCDGRVRIPYGKTITYNPSFISLQDVAGSEKLTVLSRTRTKDQDAPEVLSNIIFQLWE